MRRVHLVRKWRWVVGTISTIQLFCGVAGFVEHSRSVGGEADPTQAWVYSVLGLSGLLVLALPRLGIPIALIQGVAGLNALTWVLLGLVILQMPPGLLLPPPFGFPIIGVLLTAFGLAAGFLCLLNSVGIWQVARTARKENQPIKLQDS
jgi:hypothetical protein